MSLAFLVFTTSAPDWNPGETSLPVMKDTVQLAACVVDLTFPLRKESFKLKAFGTTVCHQLFWLSLPLHLTGNPGEPSLPVLEDTIHFAACVANLTFRLR